MKNFTYYNKFKRSHLIADIKTIYKTKNTYYFKHKEMSITGRVLRRRSMGKSAFLEIKDFSSSIQLFLSDNNIESYKEILNSINLGDIIGVVGIIFKTKTKELTLLVRKIYILSKNYQKFPDKRFGLVDKELCYRQRYLDLIFNDNSKNLFILRSNLISSIRNFFINKNFIEVETPIIQKIAGGADAEPFKTYHNSLNANLYFRISPELYLKRLIVGGIEKVFEIGKVFRNEGMSTKHHPEFTMIEFYQAYANYQDFIELTENLFKHLVKYFFDSYKIEYDNIILDFSKKFHKLNFYASIIKYCKDFTEDTLFDEEKIIDFLNKNNVQHDKTNNINDLHIILFDNFVEKNLIEPTFILHYPVSISPLSRCTDFNKNLVERFELYICTKEIANGFSELNDPTEQAIRFKKQIKDLNTMALHYDYDYINTLKYGMPPAAGEGIGLDRLIMLFTNSKSIKDVILFPFMRDK